MKNQNDEIWVEVESKGVRLMVSNMANVRSPAHTTEYSRVRDGKEQTFTSSFPDRPLAATKAKNGYLEVAPMINGRRTKHTLHRLVGVGFVPGYEDGLSINHIDGNKTNNKPDNLEWVSMARNAQHAWEIGLVDLRGENNPGHKLTTKQVVYIRRLLSQGVTPHTLAVVAGISDGMIYRIRDGKSWPTVTARLPVKPA
jgi:hypothetical protein